MTCGRRRMMAGRANVRPVARRKARARRTPAAECIRLIDVLMTFISELLASRIDGRCRRLVSPNLHPGSTSTRMERGTA